MQVRDLMTPNVLTAGANDTVAEVAKHMAARKVGAVVLTDGGPEPIGIFTDRDFLKVAAQGLDPTKASVRDHMTTGVQSVAPRADIAEACRTMIECKFRHLPVVDKDNLIGIISMRDLLTWAAREMFAAEELAQIDRSQEILTLAVEGSEGTPPPR